MVYTQLRKENCDRKPEFIFTESVSSKDVDGYNLFKKKCIISYMNFFFVP